MQLMDNLTKIDVVFPVYNGGVAFLGTLRSFSKVPDFSNIHLIISDNFSSDGSPWLPEVEKMKDAGWSVRIVSPPHFLSRVDHWTWAFEQGNSPYVKMVPVGDEILPDYFDCMLPLMDEYRAVMGICGFITHEDGKKRAPDESRTLDIYTGIAYLEKNADCGNIAGPLTAVLFRRSVVEKFLPFNPDFPWPQIGYFVCQ
jgi:GT2 family glycosyltransferase